MPYEINETHDPKLESWVESANDPETDFPIQNLPLCEVRGLDMNDSGPPTLGVRIGDQICLPHRSQVLNELWEASDAEGADQHLLSSLFEDGLLDLLIADLSSSERVVLRRLLSRYLSDPGFASDGERTLVPASEVEFEEWFGGGDYTDFYASAYHATNVGTMFRPDNPLLPNYKWIPVGYHGRASSVVPSGKAVRRPLGQQAPAGDGPEARPTFGPCKLLDYELEMGVIMGRGNVLGYPVSIEEAEEHILGLCLLNDWSARDLQKWEYQPLGPFLAKSFATSVSPYIVTMEALAPFRVPAMERAAGDPAPLPHLFSERDQSAGGIDVTLEVHLASQQMREKGMDPIRLSKGNFKDMYWTIAQMVTHHASNGCNLQPGDLLGSGTVSGPTRESRGCLLELTWDGDPWATPAVKAPGTQRTPIELPTGEMRKFLEDGDEVILKGYCEREGYRRIGFGECRGIIEPAKV